MCYFMFLELVTSYGHRGFKGKYISERHIETFPYTQRSIESSTRTDGRIERSYRAGNGGRGGGGGVIIREKFINRKVSHSDSEGIRNWKGSG